MKVVLTTIGKFHTFDLARQLHRHEMLEAIFTGYPLWKLRNENLPPELIRSFPYYQTFYMARSRFGLKSRRIGEKLGWISNRALDRYAAARLPECDLFLGLANTSLFTGRVAQSRGSIYVCDRPCSHIRYQDGLLREEYKTYNMPFEGIDPRFIGREEEEYATADAITVGSSFARRSFIKMGFDPNKVSCVPYGVDLTRFWPVGEPDSEVFDVLYVGSVSVRKGVRYLFEGFRNFKHPKKRLTIVGTITPEIAPYVAQQAQELNVTCTGHIPQPQLKEIMSRSQIMILPSVEEGLAMVQAQALACGCPVMGTTNSGAEDLFKDEQAGFILPIRDAAAITERLQRLADEPDLRPRLSAAALECVQAIGGWDTYGDNMVALFERLTGKVAATAHS